MLLPVDKQSENDGRELVGQHVLSTATTVYGKRATDHGDRCSRRTQTIPALKGLKSLYQSAVRDLIPVVPNPYCDDDREKVLTTITIGKAAV